MKKILSTAAIALLTLVSAQAQTIIFQENFDTSTTGVVPQGWSMYFESDSMAINWRVSTLVANSTRGLKHGWFSAFQNQDTANNWTVTPAIILTNDNILTFAERVWKSSPSSSLAAADAGVYISNGSPLPSSNDFVKIHAFDTTSMGNTQTFAVNLAQYAGDTVYLGFHYFGLSNTYNYGIDDLLISSPVTDGGIARIASPTGTAFPGSVQDVKVYLKNYGNTTIDSVIIPWTVNGVPQAAYTNNLLGLTSGDSIQLTIGSYNFSNGTYSISATAVVPADNNPSNNTATASYAILPTVDLSIRAIEPKGAYPIVGPQPVKVRVKNYGTVAATTCSINWWVDGILQNQYNTSFVNILPGDSTTLTIGTANYPVGAHTTAAKIANANDINPANDSLSVSSTHGTLFEDFESLPFPSEGWSTHYSLRDNILSPIQNWYFEAQAASNVFGTVSDTLFTPYLDIVAGNTISFSLRMNAFYPTTAFLIAEDKTTGNITYLDTVTSTALGWVTRNVNLTQAAGVKKIGFCFVSSSVAGGGSIDLISSTATIHLEANDLKVTDPQYDVVARVNTPYPIQVTVKNVGTATAATSAYNVKLFEGTTLLSTLPGVPLTGWQEHIFTFNPVFTNIGKHDLHVEVSYAADVNLGNNTTRVFETHSVPQNAIERQIGQPNGPNLNIPFNGMGSDFTLGTDDLSQTIYMKEELKNGFIYGYKLHVRSIITGSRKLPVKIWIKEVTQTDLNSGWVAPANFVLVFDDTVEVRYGQHEIYVPFASPYLYTSNNNIVVKSYQYDPEWPGIATSFLSNGSATTNRSRFSLDVFALDPNNPPLGNAMPDYPATDFIIDTLTDVTTVYGQVRDAITNNPIQGALVQTINVNAQTTSNAAGFYQLIPIPFGSYQLKASKLGYLDSTISATLNALEDTIDFFLTPRPQVQIEAYVTGSDAPTVGLANASASLSGYATANSTSNAQGYIQFNPVFGSANYTLTLSKKGYIDYVLAVPVGTQNINLDTLVMQQEYRSAYNVIAADALNGTDAVITWQPPLKGEEFKNQLDNNNNSYSLTNSPNENVWLGNYFQNNDTVTITSAEIYFDVYPNAHDFVTVDVFDADENLLVHSLPFQTYHDSLFVVDIPNITVVGDYYVMIHWQNNPVSTDALTIDFTPGLANNSRIKYPAMPMDTLGSYLPGIPQGAFMLRANYVNNDVVQLPVSVGYNVSRGKLSDFANVATWPVLNSSLLANTSYTDGTWGSVSQQDLFVYAVEAVYGNGNAEHTLSTYLDSKFIGIDEQLESTQLLIYPNPTQGLVQVRNLNPGSTLQVVNTFGQAIMQINVQREELTLDLRNMPTGLYLLSYTNGKTTTVEKIIVE